jgi:AraC family transcriptional regulator, transcriptional activator of the genes for pyochelin and ferripyochelin receptors
MGKTKKSGSGPWSINSGDMEINRSKGESEQLLPSDWGMGRSLFIDLDEGLSFIETKFQTNRDVSIISKVDDETARIVLTASLDGKTAYNDRNNNQVVFSGGTCTITTFRSSLGERLYTNGDYSHQLRLTIRKSWLDKYVGHELSDRLFSKKDLKVISSKALDSQSLLMAQQIAHFREAGELSKLSLHGNALMLLAAQLSDAIDEGVRSVPAPRDDKQIKLVYAARDILISEYRRPPSIKDLASMIGTNQFKLKMLFHKYLSTTPYSIVTDMRMRTAYDLMVDGRLTVGEVSEYVGYQHISNFSAAFKRYHGVSPNSIKRR